MANRLQQFLASRWLSVGAQAAFLQLVIVGGTIGDVARTPGARPLQAFIYPLLILLAASRLVAVRYPVTAYIVAIGTTCTYVAAGYSTAGPVVVGLLVMLFLVVAVDRPARTVAIGATTIIALGVAAAVRSGPGVLLGSMLDSVGIVVVPLAVGYVVAYRRLRGEEAREAEAQRRLTDERVRIARELHDVVSHSISLINVQAGVAAHVMDEQPEKAREALLVIKATSKEALRELRGILGVLRDVDDPELREPAPGLAQLPSLIETSQRAGLPATLTVAGDARPLSPAVDLAAYRIVQEGLTNVQRHAGPASADVKVVYEPLRLVIEVVDDGAGLGSLPADQAGGGHGIAGMRERAAAVGGQLETGPRPTRGYRVRASLPVDGSVG